MDDHGADALALRGGGEHGQLQAQRRIGVRWTIGAVSERGFEALRLSVWGAFRIFGPGAVYAVCVNTLPLAQVRERTGPLPAGLQWIDASALPRPRFLLDAFGPGMLDGYGWKLAPLRLFPDRHELSLDNDCILWRLPASMADWLARDAVDGCLLAQDVHPCFGQFAPECPKLAVNAGIRGLPPGFDLAAALQEALARRAAAAATPVVFTSDQDEQGLQASALSVLAPLQLVALREVSICSPFHPHQPELGSCGAHFVGLNAHHIPWAYYERPADDCMREHWARHRGALLRHTGAPDPGLGAPDAAPAELAQESASEAGALS